MARATRSKVKKSLLVPKGVSGLERYGGYVYEEQLRTLKGGRWIKTIEQMSDNSPVVSSILYAITMLMRQVDFSIRPFTDAPDAMFQAEFVDGNFKDMSMSWSDIMSYISTFPQFGFQATEIGYKQRRGPNPGFTRISTSGGRKKVPLPVSRFNDGLIGWRGWYDRPQNSIERWMFDNNGGIQGLYQQAAPDYEIIPIAIERLLLFRTTARKNNPEGRSILRGAYQSWYYSSGIKRIEAIGAERDLAGLPMIKIPAEMLASDDPIVQAAVAQYKTILTNVRNDEQMGIMFPSDTDDSGNPLYSFELIKSGGSKQFNTNKIIDRYDRDIARAMFAEMIVMGNNNAALFDSSSGFFDLFVTALVSFLDQIEDTINAHAIPRLLRLNGMDTSIAPQFVFGDIQKVSLSALGDFIQKISGAGAQLFPDEDLQEHLRQVARLPVAKNN